jgi:hypothetical protein
MEVVKTGDTALEYQYRGAGEPVLLIPPDPISGGLALPSFSVGLLGQAHGERSR